MANDIISRLRHPKEEGYGIVMLIFGIIYWVFIVIFLVGALIIQPATGAIYVAYAIAFALFLFISAALFRAKIYGNYVLIGPNQFPHLHNMVQQGAANVRLTPAPTAFIYNSNGLMNAFARRLFGGRFIFLTSAIVEAETDEQIKFVIGHELGHHAAGHLSLAKNILKGPAHLIRSSAPPIREAANLPATASAPISRTICNHRVPPCKCSLAAAAA